MRIIGGKLRGRTISGPKGKNTRPSSDRAREAIASALQARNAILNARMLDLFAGTGAFGFEMLSRGAAQALFVDVDHQCLSSIQKSAINFEFQKCSHTLKADLIQQATHFADTLQSDYQLVFADPPYQDSQALVPLFNELVRCQRLAEDAWIVWEFASKQPPEELPSLSTVANYRYGDTSIRLMQFQRQASV